MSSRPVRLSCPRVGQPHPERGCARLFPAPQPDSHAYRLCCWGDPRREGDRQRQAGLPRSAPLAYAKRLSPRSTEGYGMCPGKRGRRRAAAVAAGGLVMLSPGASMAQGDHLTARDYAQAERFMPYNAGPLVDHDVLRVNWLDDRRFWYVDHDSGGDRYLVMTAATGQAAPIFDRQKLAGALDKAIGEPVDATRLAISAIRIEGAGRYEITRDGKRYLCDLADAGHCVNEAALIRTGRESGIASPDGKLEAFVRDWNLWVRDLATGKETQLTFDGRKDFGYATDNAGWRQSERPVLDWSPDSTRIATYRQDQRGLGEMDLVSTRVGHPGLKQWKYPLPGDSHVFKIAPVIVAVATRRLVPLQM